MPAMNQSCRHPSWGLLAALLAVAGGCSRPVDFHAKDDGAQQGKAQPPSYRDTKDAGAQGRSQGPKALPFRNSQSRSLPAGTLVTVRLEKSLSSARSDASGAFTAVVDEPIIIDGATLVPRGAGVAGRIESARASPVKRDTGYVRLTLNSITIAGRDLPVQTSSLFARGHVRVSNDHAVGPNHEAQFIDLKKGRRLTFRITTALSLPDQGDLSGHLFPYAKPSSDSTPSSEVSH